MGRPVNERPRRLRKIMRRVANRPFNVERHLLMRKMQLSINATPHERSVRKLLDQAGYRYQFQKGFLSGGVMYIADFYLPRPYQLVIEVDGGYHETIDQRKKDADRDRYFHSRGFKVLRIKNQHVDTMTSQQLSVAIEVFSNNQ